MLGWFEKLLYPYPDTAVSPPPARFLAFVWACTHGLRRHLLAMTLLTALIGAFEALLFAVMGRIVDWLSHVPPALLWTQERGNLLLLAAVILASPLLIAMQTLVKHQSLAGNFPMRLRWNFHRLMLSQSMSFYQDEFAGRVSAKVMQTALAVREMWFIVGDILVFVVIYFVTLVAVVGTFHP
ncbi:MAG TPA: multidrug ABC transporter ATP-binding protein, partial [Methylophilaceae bacterium]|nr:multidrug ABC transporter ATP-binding protein [Methylophilaceae bacterium]